MFTHVLNTSHAVQVYRKPLLIVHGQLDTMITPDHAEALFAISASRKKHLKILPTSDHNNLDWDTIIDHFNKFVH